jgi:hypothetical protein
MRIAALILLACLLPVARAQTDWKAIRGVNYIPSYGRNLYEIWRGYNHEAFDSELALARNTGYNSVRIWLNYFAWAENPKKFLNDVADAMTLCRKHQLRVLLVLFDSCGIRPRANSRLVRVQDAYNAFINDPNSPQKLKDRIRFTYKPYAEGPGRDVLVAIGDGTPPEVILWQHWQPSPGYDKMGANWRSKLAQFVTAVTDRLAEDRNILAWDLMNEPEFAAEDPFEHGLNDDSVRELVEGFLRHMRQTIKTKHPDALTTVGFAALESCMRYEQLADVLTYHVYGEPDRIQASVEKANAFAAKAGKPIFITETLANFTFPPYDVAELATDQGQLEHYRKVLPALLKANIGWMAWGLVVGRIFDSYTDIFYANGHPRPAALYLREMLRKGQ